MNISYKYKVFPAQCTKYLSVCVYVCVCVCVCASVCVCLCVCTVVGIYSNKMPH